MSENAQSCGACKWFDDRWPGRKQTSGANCTWPILFVVCNALKPYMPSPITRQFVWRDDGANCPTFAPKEPPA